MAVSQVGRDSQVVSSVKRRVLPRLAEIDQSRHRTHFLYEVFFEGIWHLHASAPLQQISVLLTSDAFSRMPVMFLQLSTSISSHRAEEAVA